MIKPNTRIPQKSKANVPALRFQEFEGEWSRQKIKDVSSVKSGSTPLRSNKLFFQDGNLPWVKTTDLNNYFIYETEECITDYALKNTSARLNPVTSVLVAMYGGFNQIGRTGFLKVEASTNQALSVLNADENKVLPLYLLIWLNAKVNVWRRFAGSSRKDPNITGSDVKSFPIAFPSLPEQQKIASFLSAIDQKIQQLHRKKALLAQYKKGCMQQLFSRQLRFKDENGEDFPDWEEKRLGEIATNISYGMNSAATNFDGSNKYIRITDIDDKSRKFAPRPLTSPEGVLAEKYLVKKDDILFVRTGASVGKSYLYSRKDGKLYFAGFLIRFSIDQAHSPFVFYQTLTSRYRKWVKVMSMRSGQPGINAEEYKSFKIPFPSLPEQQKIANFLSNIDNKIATVAKQITQAQSFKKGLLQQLFV